MNIDLTGSIGGWIIIGLVVFIIILIGYSFYTMQKSEKDKKINFHEILIIMLCISMLAFFCMFGFILFSTVGSGIVGLILGIFAGLVMIGFIISGGLENYNGDIEK